MPNPLSTLSDTVVVRAVNAYLCLRHARLVRRYRRRIGHLPAIASPRRYTERMLWRKLVDRNPLFVVFSDKLATKEYIRSRCPELSVARVFWIGSEVDAIPEEALRGDVFVKANHGCNFNYRVRGGRCDCAALHELTRLWLGSVYGWKNGEWAYACVQPQLFVEEAVGDVAAGLLEFNVRAANGRVILGSVLGACKTPAQWMVYLNAAGEAPPELQKPAATPPPASFDPRKVLEPYHRAVAFARQLSMGVDYARYDFLWNGRELFGGEITVFPAGGTTEIANPAVNAATLGGWDLRESHFLKTPQVGWKRLYAAALKRRLTRQSATG
jgi:hypothetical protein